MEGNDQHDTRCFSPGKEPGAHWLGSWFARFGRGKILLYLQDSKPPPYYTYDGILVHQKEVVVAYFKISSRNLSEGTEEENEKRVRIVGAPAGIERATFPLQVKSSTL